MPYKDYYNEYIIDTVRKHKHELKGKSPEGIRKEKFIKSKIEGSLEYKIRRLQKKYGKIGVDVFLRDLCQCVKCGESDFRILNLHHKIPKAKGGLNTEDNLETICSNCHGITHFMEDLPYTSGNNIPQIAWDIHWMKFAISIEKYSSCYSRNIGSALVKNNKLISIGWNGPPSGIPLCHKRNPNNEKICPRKLIGAKSGERLDLCIALHSEAASILNCAKEGKYSTKESTLYCNCGVPCQNCMILIIQSGIKRVVCNSDNTTGNYGIYYDLTSKYLHEQSKIKIDFIDV